MNTPKTAALWELLREMGWSEDQRPVSFIMQSHAELEKELSDLEAGFDADGRTAAEACCEAFKREQAERIKTLERQLTAETARADEQFALAMELAAKLETERALADKLAARLEQCREDSTELLGERHWWKDEPRCGYSNRYDETAENVVAADEALAAYKAARNEADH